MENLNSVNDKKGKRPSKVAYLHAHGSKKFEVELFAGQNEVYKKLFRVSSAHRISIVQIVVAAIVVMAQISTMCLLRYYTSLEYQGAGIWTSVITVISAGFSLSACRKTTYVRLHFAMAFHIMSIIGSIFLLSFAFADSIRDQNRRLFNYLTRDSDYPNNRNYYNYNYNRNYYDSENNYTTPPSYYPKYYNSYDDQGPIGVLLTTLALSSIMAFGGLVQLVLSLVMSVMSGRAMCAGRSKMEGKIFAMKIKGQEEGDVTAAAASNNIKDDMTEIGLNSLPPPYDKLPLEHKNDSSFA